MTGSLVSAATRQRVRDLATPLAMALGRLGLTPNSLTVIGFAGTALAALAAAYGWWFAAGILVLGFGIFDLFDGALARATGRASRLGAFLDSTFDRAGEALVYVGVIAGSLTARFELGALLAGTAMAAAFMVPYARAKAESLGFSPGNGLMNVGLAPREVRTAILGFALIIVGIVGPVGPLPADFVCPDLASCVSNEVYLPGDRILGGALALITILATITVIQRILHVRAQSREG